MTDFYTTIDTLHDVLKDDIDTKQNTLTAGTGIDITDDVISATATGGKIPFAICTTAHATAAKKITIPDYTLQTGDVIVVKFNNTNTASNPTLSVNDGTAYPLLFYGSQVVGTYPWRAGTVQTLTFDGTSFYLNGHSGASVSYLGLVKLSSSIVSTSETYAATPKAVKTLNDNKQEKLNAGDNIAIDQTTNTISATDTTYSAGRNITIDENNEISATVPSVSATSNYADGVTLGTVTVDSNTTTFKSPYWVGATDGGITVGTSGYRREIAADFTKIQEKLTAGANVAIDTDTNTISATDTTYTAGNGIELTSGEFRLGFPAGRFDSTTGNTLDLNNVTVEGFHRYYINTEYVQNFPEDGFYSTGEFYVNLLVIKSYSVNRNAQVLYVVDAHGGRLFYRTKITTSAWGRWQRIDDEPRPEPDTKTVVTPAGSTVYFRTIDCVQDTNNTLTYKWQVSSNYGRTWQDASGTGYNTNTLTVSATAGRNNYFYRCVISGATQSVTTTASRLVVLS